MLNVIEDININLKKSSLRSLKIFVWVKLVTKALDIKILREGNIGGLEILFSARMYALEGQGLVSFTLQYILFS